MRCKGRITEWQDERGFGFVTPMGCRDRVFVHITSFTNRGRRPVGGELVTYELKRDPKGRLQGADVSFSGDPVRRASRSGPGVGSQVFAVTFLAFVAMTVSVTRLPSMVLAVYVVTSAVTCLAYAWDKTAAQKNEWRTRERTLLMLGLFGGWPGALAAQTALRHKSTKESFQRAFRRTVVANCAVFLWLLLGALWLSLADGVVPVSLSMPQIWSEVLPLFVAESL